MAAQEKREQKRLGRPGSGWLRSACGTKVVRITTIDPTAHAQWCEVVNADLASDGQSRPSTTVECSATTPFASGRTCCDRAGVRCPPSGDQAGAKRALRLCHQRTSTDHQCFTPCWFVFGRAMAASQGLGLSGRKPSTNERASVLTCCSSLWRAAERFRDTDMGDLAYQPCYCCGVAAQQ